MQPAPAGTGLPAHSRLSCRRGFDRVQDLAEQLLRGFVELAL